MAHNLNPKDYEDENVENGFEQDDEHSGSLNDKQRTDYTDLDESRGDGDENGGRGVTTDQSISKKNDLKKLGILMGLLVAAIFVVMGLFSLLKGEPQEQQVQSTQETPTEEIANTKPHEFTEEELPVPVIDDVAASDVAASDVAASDIVIADTPQQPVMVQAASEPTPPPVNPVLERRLGGSVLVNDGNLKEAEAQPVSVNQNDMALSENSENEKSFNLSGSIFTPRVAQQRGNKTLLLTRGTTIPCVLVTKIVTDHAGITKCQATKDVWSANGKTVLIERGSVFLGEQTAAMLQGQARVAVRWTQVETPKGVVVQIDSPSVGKLGAAGNAAYVNYHFWKRFGGSVMISLIGDLSNGLSKRLSKRDADVTFEQSNENANSMAEEALRNSINIPPTGTINQGALLNIMVARDVDFNGVYERVDMSDWLY